MLKRTAMAAMVAILLVGSWGCAEPGAGTGADDTLRQSVVAKLDAANIAFNLLKSAADGLHIGPMLLGTAQPAHVLTSSVTARGILNMTALAVVEAQRLAEARG